MGNWIDEEAKNFQREKEEQLQKEYLINYSNYRTELRRQIERDVNEINNHPVWKEASKGTPITVVNYGNGYQVQKLVFPVVYITVKDQGEEIELVTAIKKEAA